MNFLLEVCGSLFLGGVFLWSAVPKLRHPRGFVLVVLEYRVLPPSPGRLYGWLLPPLELFLALLFLSGTAIKITSAVAVLCLASFIVAVGLNIARGRDLDCQCFGAKRRRKIGVGLLLQDSLLLIIALLLTFLASTWIGVESWSVFRLFGLFHLAGLENLAALLVCGVLAICAGFLLRVAGELKPLFLARRRQRNIAKTVDG